MMWKPMNFDHAPIKDRVLWWKRAGAAGFAFFLFKGMLWLLTPALLYLIRS